MEIDHYENDLPNMSFRKCANQLHIVMSALSYPGKKMVYLKESVFYSEIVLAVKPSTPNTGIQYVES